MKRSLEIGSFCLTIVITKIATGNIHLCKIVPFYYISWIGVGQMKRFIEDFNRYNYANLELTVNSRTYRVKDRVLNKEVLFPNHSNEKLDRNDYFKFRSLEDDYIPPQPSSGADFYFEKHKGIYFDKYGEFFISLTEMDFMRTDTKKTFSIGGVSYEVSEPSHLMLLFFGNYHENKCRYLSLKVTNTSKKYFKRDVEKGLFHLGQSMSELKEYPKIQSFVPNNSSTKMVRDRIYIDTTKINWESPYIESLSILNKAKTYKDLLSYYRFLEYYFYISQVDLLKGKIKEYQGRLEDMTESDDQDFLKSFTSITKHEKEALTSLLERLNKKKILSAYEELGLAEKNQKVTIELVAMQLYTFRNENVHAKKHNKGRIDFCNSFLNDNHNAWRTMFEILAEMVVKEFLYQK